MAADKGTGKATDVTSDKPAEPATDRPTTDTPEEDADDGPPSSAASTNAPSTPTAVASRSPVLKPVDDAPEPAKTPTPLSPRAEPFSPALKPETVVERVSQQAKSGEQSKGKAAAPAESTPPHGDGDKGRQPEAGESAASQTSLQKQPPVTPKFQKGFNASPSKGAQSIAAKVEAAVKTGSSVIPTVLQVSDMHWFTSDADLLEAASSAGVEVTFKDITFLEHKCNGKSKG